MSSAVSPSPFDESADFEGKLEPLHWYKWPNTKNGWQDKKLLGNKILVINFEVFLAWLDTM